MMLLIIIIPAVTDIGDIPDSPDAFFVGLIVFRKVGRLQLSRLHVQVSSTHRLQVNIWRMGSQIFIPR